MGEGEEFNSEKLSSLASRTVIYGPLDWPITAHVY